jgi:hypothetical protein
MQAQIRAVPTVMVSRRCVAGRVDSAGEALRGPGWNESRNRPPLLPMKGLLG